MALKVVKSPRPASAPAKRHATVRTPGYNPLDATSATLECDLCGKAAFVTFVPGSSHHERQQLIQAALTEHRAIVCSGAASEARITRLWVPGK